MKKLTMLAFAVAAVAGPANAVLLYNQDPHTPGASGGNGLSNFKGSLSGTPYDRRVADDFVVTDAAWSITAVDITGIWFSAPYTKDPSRGFNVAFYANTGAGPGTGAGVNSTVLSGTMTGGVYFSRDARKWLIDIPKVTLGAGTYWVSIQPDHDENFFQLTAASVTGSECYVNYSDFTGGAWAAGSTIFGSPYDVAFSLHGERIVPEPATLLAFGAGIAALAARRRRK
jgi:hypothetical protein